jgi:environmental stress-induced protein Ves
MRIIRAGDCRTTPWKNGGGSTTEIAIGPAGASLEDFDWRISMARVAADGPFSDFPGIDRTLAVIKGGGMVLTIGDRPRATLSRGSDPVSFSGDTPTSARLTAGEITDLNVMTRRGRFGHRVERITQPMTYHFGGYDVAVLLSLNGKTTVAVEQDRATLNHGDAVVLSRITGDLRVASTSDCHLVWLSDLRRESPRVVPADAGTHNP